MTKSLMCTTVVVALALAGCGQLAVLPDGRVVLRGAEPTVASDILGAGAGGQVEAAPVLQAFDAAEGEAARTVDPNSRAGANCSGGVCAIF